MIEFPGQKNCKPKHNNYSLKYMYHLGLFIFILQIICLLFSLSLSLSLFPFLLSLALLLLCYHKRANVMKLETEYRCRMFDCHNLCALKEKKHLFSLILRAFIYLSICLFHTQTYQFYLVLCVLATIFPCQYCCLSDIYGGILFVTIKNSNGIEVNILWFSPLDTKT